MAEQMVTQDELFNGDPDLREDSTDSNTQGNSSYSFDSDMSYDDMLNVIMGRDDYISRPPSSESGFYVDPETGQAYTNYEAMSNEDRLTAWDAWYQEAEAYGYENLNANDQMLYIQNAYRLGYIDAATADEMWEPLHNEMMVANGWTLESDGTWRREREGGGGRTIIETAEAPTFSGGNYGESGAWDGSIQGEDTPGVFNENYANMNNQWNNYERTVEGASGLQGLFATVMSEVAPIVVKGTLAWATGQALNPMIISALGSAGITGSAATAIASAVSSQVANGFINGEMSLEGALAAGLSGYLSSGGLSDLIGEASGTFDELMNTVNQAMELGTGSEFIAAMVQAGATNVLMQYAATGEIDPVMLASSLVSAGLISELSEVVQQGLESGNMSEEDIATLQEMEEWDALEQAAINADIKDPFLNPNYTTVGEGLIVDANGNVFNYDGDNMGTMDALDIDGDGMLTGSDLQEVTVDAEIIPVTGSDFTVQEGTRYYKDINGNLVAQGDITGLRVDRDTGNYVDTDGNVYVYAGQGNAAGEVFDPQNGILTAADGTVLAVYDPDVGWVDTEGNYVGAAKEEYLNYLSSGDPSGATQGFGMTQEDYDNMSGQELVDDLFVQRGADGQVRMTTEELSAVMQKFGSVEEFEQYMQEQGIGVNVSGDTVVLVGGALNGSDEGVWNITDGTDPLDLYGEPNELSGTLFVDPDSPDIYAVEESPFAEEPVEPEPVQPEDVQETEPDPTDSMEQPETGVETAPSTPAPGVNAELEQLEEQYQQAVSQGDYITANMILAQIQQMQQEQVVEDDVTNIFEDTASAIEDAGGTFQQEVSPEKPEVLFGNGTETTEQPVEDNRTQWQKNKDFIISQVEAGTATDGQQAWYDQWVEAGSPDTQQGMVQGDAENGTAGTTEPGAGGTGTESTEAGGGATTPGSTVGGTPDKPTSPVGSTTPGPTLGFGPGDSTGAPGTGDGGGGGGGAGRGGMMTGGFKPAPFQTFQSGISYTAPTIQSLVQSPQVDYVAALNNIINRGMLT
jgi:hypothetical protein